jgi:hypothetical protein
MELFLRFDAAVKLGSDESTAGQTQRKMSSRRLNGSFLGGEGNTTFDRDDYRFPFSCKTNQLSRVASQALCSTLNNLNLKNLTNQRRLALRQEKKVRRSKQQDFQHPVIC